MTAQPERCETCRCWRQHTDDHDLGDCRRFPPTLPGMTLQSGRKTVAFPELARNGWCGEWRKRDASGEADG